MDHTTQSFDRDRENSDRRLLKCLTEMQLLQLMEGALSKQEQQNAFAHLNACKKCFKTFLSLASVFTQFDLQEAIDNALPAESRSQEQQVDWILKAIRADKQKPGKTESTEEPASATASSKKAAKQQKSVPGLASLGRLARAGRQFFKKSPIPAFGGVALIVIVVAALLFRQSDFREAPPRDLFEDMVIFFRDGKLTGNFGVQPIGEKMSQADSPEADAIEAAVQATSAPVLQGNATTAELHTFFKALILAERFAAADTIIQKLHKHQNLSAAVLNDIGVYYFKRELRRMDPNFERAEAAFQQALQQDPDLKEGYYNLALIRSQQGDARQAIQFFDRFLELETSEDWRTAAMELQTEQEQLRDRE